MSPTRKKPTGRVVLVGAGPGDPELLTLRGAAVLAEASLVVGHRELHAGVLDRLPAGTEILDVAEHTGGDAELTKQIIARAKSGEVVVRLFTGDPFLGCHGPALGAALTKAKITWELVPGVSAATGVPAYAGIPLIDGSGQPLTVADVGDQRAIDWAALAGAATLVLLGAENCLGKVAAGLIEHGRPGETPVAMTRCGTTPQQQTVVSTLERIEADAAEADLTPPAVTVVGDVVTARPKLSWYETRPLFGWQILVPRTRAQAGSLSAHIRAKGGVPVEVPTIAVEPPRTPAQMDRAIKGLVSGRYQWVVFTSTNALRAVREKLEEVGLDARAMSGLRVAAIGETTAAALRGWGIEPELVPSGDQSSEGLLADFPPYDDVLDPIDRVLLPRADIATETLVAGLRERGWEVEDVTAYRTVRAAPPPAHIRDAIKTGGFDAALFTSSSTVRNLVGIAGKPHEATVVACIGPATTRTAEEFGLRVDVVAPTASVEALVQALAEHAVSRRADDGLTPSQRLAARKAKRSRK